jgi:hypothetical protein
MPSVSQIAAEEDRVRCEHYFPRMFAFVPPRGLGRSQPQIAPPAPDAGRGVAKRRRGRRVELRRLPQSHAHRKDAPLHSNPNGAEHLFSHIRQESTNRCMQSCNHRRFCSLIFESDRPPDCHGVAARMPMLRRRVAGGGPPDGNRFGSTPPAEPRRVGSDAEAPRAEASAAVRARPFAAVPAPLRPGTPFLRTQPAKSGGGVFFLAGPRSPSFWHFVSRGTIAAVAS